MLYQISNKIDDRYFYTAINIYIYIYIYIHVYIYIIKYVVVIL